MRTLYPDQVELLDQARGQYREGKKAVCLLAPTGFGKTLTGAEMVSGASRKGLSVLWLNHRRELIRQSSQSFFEQGIDHGIIAAGGSSDPGHRIQIGSVATVARRLDRLPIFDLIIADEAHHVASTTWSRIIDAYPAAKVLGLTATPWRLDGTGLGKWFEALVEGPTVAWLIENKRLSPYKLFSTSTPDVSEVKSSMGDFKSRELAAVMDKPVITGSAVGHYKKLTPGKRAVAFCVSIEHSKHVASEFVASGIPAAHIDGTMPSFQRDATMKAFERGEVLVLCNVDLIGEGVDVPAIECVILLRPTQSLTLYLQAVGRGLRLSPGKEFCIILDHAGNCARHGLPDDDREWSLEDREKKRKGAKSEVMVRTCAKCFRVYRPQPSCPGCGFQPVGQAREVEQVEGELVEVDRERARIVRKQEERRASSLDDLIALGLARGYKNPRVWAQKFHEARGNARARYQPSYSQRSA